MKSVAKLADNLVHWSVLLDVFVFTDRQCAAVREIDALAEGTVADLASVVANPMDGVL